MSKTKNVPLSSSSFCGFLFKAKVFIPCLSPLVLQPLSLVDEGERNFRIDFLPLREMEDSELQYVEQNQGFSRLILLQEPSSSLMYFRFHSRAE